MRVGIVGLGRMGAALSLNLLDKGFTVVGFNRSPEDTRKLVRNGLDPAYTLADLCLKLPSPKVIWLMVPAGKPVDSVIEGLLPMLKRGDVIIDGGNSNYLDSKRRHSWLAKHEINFMDCGTSGGLEGARNGACLTVGGDLREFKKLEPLFKAAAAQDGYMYCGPAGAGHYVKTVHNGIEYAMLEAYGEGFELLAKAPYKIDLEKVAKTWSHGSVIRSWLSELAQRAFAPDPSLSKISPVIGGGETGRWTVQEAKRRKVPVPIIELALKRRKQSEKTKPFSGKVVNALRFEFGGHHVKK